MMKNQLNNQLQIIYWAIITLQVFHSTSCKNKQGILILNSNGYFSTLLFIIITIKKYN